jgi:hypothetical protein
MKINDCKIYGYEYYGYNLNEVGKWKDTDKLLREFIEKRKKSKKLKVKQLRLIGF